MILKFHYFIVAHLMGTIQPLTSFQPCAAFTVNMSHSQFSTHK